MAVLPEASIVGDLMAVKGRSSRGLRIVFAPVAVLASALLIVACGSSSPKPAATGGSPAPTKRHSGSGSTRPSSTGTRLVVTVAIRSGKPLLVTAAGQVVYHLSSEDAGGVGGVGCTGACTQTWHPVGLPPGDLAPVAAPSLAQRLDLVTRPDGVEQVAYRGEPLYTYVGIGVPVSHTPEGTWSAIAVTGLASPPVS